MNRAAKASLLAAATLLILLTVVVNYLSTSELGRRLGLFSNDSGVPWNQRGHLNDSSLTPPGYAFAIWGVIYAYQAAAFVYCWTLVFRRDSSGEYLCCLPGLMPAGFLVCHSVSSLLNVAWIFLADRVDAEKSLLVPQTVAIFSLAAALWASTGVSVASLAANGRSLVAGGLKRDLWTTVGLVQNSLALYAGWVTVASFINLDIAIINLANYLPGSSGLLCLGHVAAIVAAYAVADFSFLDTGLRFVLGTYASALWALVTSLAKNFDPESATSVATAELIALVAALLVAKAILAVVRQCNSPLPRRQRPSDSDELPIDPFSNSKVQLLM